MLAPFTAVASSTLPVAGNAASVTSNSLTSTPPVAASRYQNMLIACFYRIRPRIVPSL